jgi:hypothetical protein
MQSLLLRRVAQLSSRLSRFLAERSADFVNGATPHNDDVFRTQVSRLNEESCCLH